MKTLEETRAKYPRAHYAPDPDCRKCKGAGEFTWTPKGQKERLSPCACIFIDKAYRETVVKLLSKTAKRILNEMKNPLSHQSP